MSNPTNIWHSVTPNLKTHLNVLLSQFLVSDLSSMVFINKSVVGGRIEGRGSEVKEKEGMLEGKRRQGWSELQSPVWGEQDSRIIREGIK